MTLKKDKLMEAHTTVTMSPDELFELIRSAVRASLRDFPSMQEAGGGLSGAKRRKFISPKEIEEEFGINRRLLQDWRQAGIGPAYTNFGRRVFYDRVNFEKFAASGHIQTTGQVD